MGGKKKKWLVLQWDRRSDFNTYRNC